MTADKERQMDNRLVSAREVARMCRVRAETVLEWLHSGDLPATRRGTRWYILAEDLGTFLRERAAREAEARRASDRVS